MKVNNNLSTLVSDVFQKRELNNKTDSLSRNKNSISNKYSSGYYLDISQRGLDILESLGDMELAIFNSDIQSYSRLLDLRYK